MTPHLPDERLSAYLDGELAPSEVADVERLLSDSPEARRQLDELRELGGLLRDVPSDLAPSDLSQRVLAQAERESLIGKPVAFRHEVKELTTWNRSRRWLFAVVSCAGVVCVLAVTLWTQSEPQVDRSLATSDYDMVEEGTLGRPETPSEVRLRLAENLREPSGASGGIGGGAMTNEFAEFPDRMVIESDRTSSVAGIPYLSTKELKDAKIGDVISGWKLQDQDVVVVELTVIDRRQVFDSLQILLSDLNIQNEPPSQDEPARGASNADEILAVYVEADQTRMEAALAELRDNMEIASIEVSTVIPTNQLAPILVSNGYTPTPFNAPEMAESRAGIAPFERARDQSEAIASSPQVAKPATVPRAESLEVAPPPPPLAEPNEQLAYESKPMQQYRQRAIRVQQDETEQILGDKVLRQQVADRDEAENLVTELNAAKDQPASLSEPETKAEAPTPGRALSNVRGSRNGPTRSMNFLFLVVPKQSAPAREAGSSRG